MLLEENIADSISISSNSGHSQPIFEHSDAECDTEYGAIGGGGIGGGDIGGGSIGGGGIGGGGLGNNVCRNAMHFFPNSDTCY